MFLILLHCPKKIGTVQHFRPCRCRKRCTVPMFLGPGMQKHCTVPKNSKKPIFSGSPGQRLGQYGVFASLSQKDWDSTAFSAPGGPEVLYCPNLFETERQRHRTVPILDLETLRRLFFFQFFGTAQRFCMPGPKNIGTVQRFRHLEGLKCCTVPIFQAQKSKNPVLSQSLSSFF